MHKLNAALFARILPRSLFVAGAMLCSLVGSLLLSSPTHAQQPAPLPASLVKQAKQRALMEAMYSCLASSDIASVEVDSVIAGKLSGITMRGYEYVSPLFDEDGDAALNCESEIPQAIKDAFGYSSYIDMVCEFGFVAFDPSDGCDKNSSNYGSSKRYQFRDSARNKLKQALIRRSSSSIGEKDNDLLNYVVAYTALTSNGSAACQATFVGAKTSDGEQNAAISAKKGVSAWVAGRNGAFDAFFRLSEGKDTGFTVNLFSYRFHRSGSGGNGDRKNCQEIARWVSDLAPKVANTLVQAGNESTNNEVINALVGKFCQGLTGYPLSSCQSDVKKWVEACRSKLPASGNVANSDEYILCLSTQSGRDSDEIKNAINSISIPDESSQTEEEGVTCAIEGIGWMICPMIRFVADMSDNIYGFLSDSFLQIETKLFDTNNNTYTAWVVIRNIANSLFVVAFIFIVYSQITGAGISNYGIKKMLPMLLIAALLVNMSYFICQLAVDLSNILGGSVYGMFKGWAGSMNTGSYAAVDEFTTGGLFGGIAIVVLAGVGGYLALSALSAAAVATIIALLSVFLLLIARKALIILLVVIAPLAFVALLLPNTQSLFTKWRKIFVSMLLVYPIIGLLFGSGSLAATILNGAGAGGDTIMQIVGALSAVLPLFLVIPILKKSMDAMGAIGATINGASGKLSSVASGKTRQAIENSKFRGFRKARREDIRARMATGTYRGRGGMLNPRNWISGANRMLNNSTAFNKLTGGYGAMRNLNAQQQNRKDMQDTIDMFGNDDELVKAWAITGGDIKALAANGISLSSAQREQFKKMNAAGLHRKDMSHIAAAQYLSQNGKGSSSHILSALNNAKNSGADDTTIGNAWASSIVNYRKSGRGDVLGELNAHQAANGGAPPVGPGAILENNANTLRNSRQTAWQDIDASNVHRDALNNPSGLSSYQAHLAADQAHLISALIGYNNMEARAKKAAHDSILQQANATAAAQGATTPFATIEDAKKYFLAP